MNLRTAVSFSPTQPRPRQYRWKTHIQVAPIPKKEEAMTGEIHWVRLAVHANQNRQICSIGLAMTHPVSDLNDDSVRTGKANAATIDMGSRASGLILPPVSSNFSSK